MRYVNLHKKDNKVQSSTRVIRGLNLRLIFILTGVFAVAYFGVYIFNLFSQFKVKAGDILKAPAAAVSYIANKDPQLMNDNGRVNIALLGIGGKGHDGAFLTDTVMLASIDLKTGNAVMISLPRDTWVQQTRSKLNAVYAYGWEKGDGQGLKQIKDVLGKSLGIPVQYGFRIDFSGFEKAIDLVGGVDVDVDNSFKDYEYPITGRENDLCGNKEVEEKIASDSGEITVKKLVDAQGNELGENVNPYACRYEVLSFIKGKTSLDGERALKYVRSRHGTNGEGSDFARSKRQQKVIEGVKEKVFSTSVLLDGGKVGSILQTLGNSVDTDIQTSEYGEFLKLAQRYKEGKTRAFNITADGVDPLLTTPLDNSLYGGAYVLVPTAGQNDWSVVHAKVKTWLNDINLLEKTASASATPKL